MTTSVIDLLKRLQRSLDSNYNVIDLVAVFEIIRTLEGTPITTEQLETTRLAKYINQLRRKTTNEQLARQAKNLLKKWRDNLIPAIAVPAPAAAAAAQAPPAVAALSNGLRSQPTTPSRPVSVNQLGSGEKVITIPDDDESQGSSNHTASRRFGSNSSLTTATVGHEGSGGGAGGGGGGGAGLSIPSELTNFYLKNKKIIDGPGLATVKEEVLETNHHHHQNHFNNHSEQNDAVEEERHRRKARKKSSKGAENFNSNSNSGFADNSTTAATTVGKKVKTTRQLVAEMKFRNEQNLRNASYPDLSGADQEHNNNHSNLSSPMSASNDSHHMFHHHHHNQHHQGGHNHRETFHSAPVTPSGSAFPVKREAEDAASERKREKKRRKLEKEQAEKLRLKKKKKEKTPPPVSGMNFLNQVDEDIWQLKNRLPPIDRKAILRQMKAENIALAQAERQCTCQLVECSQEEAERACGVVIASLDDIPALPAVDSLPGTSGGGGGDQGLPLAGSAPGELPSAQQNDPSAKVPPTMVNVVRNKKSIFDDDDGGMDDVAVVTGSPGGNSASIDKNNNSEEEGTNSRDERFPFPRTLAFPDAAHPPPMPVPVPIAAPGADEEPAPVEEERIFYKAVEEPGCPVKRRKEDLLRLNPDYHLAALHQLYVPGVNGNWSAFPDLAILRKRALEEQKNQTPPAIGNRLPVKRKRKRSSSDSSDDDDDSEVAQKLGADNGALIECLGRLQDAETEEVDSVVPLINPFFFFLKPGAAEDINPANTAAAAAGTNLLANMAGRLPRYVPLRTDFGPVIIPPPMPEEGAAPPTTPPPVQFNRELAKELGIEGVREGLKGDVYEPKELQKFLEAALRQRLPKFQMANLFYKRSWPGVEDRDSNLSLELLNSLYLNRVLEFRRRRRRHLATRHRKHRRKSGEGDEEDEDGAVDEEVEVTDVHVFDGFLQMQTMQFRNIEEQRGNGGGGGSVAVRSARRLFYVNDDRMFGHLPSIFDEDTERNQLPLLDDWDLFRVRFEALEFLPPVLSATARLLYASWSRMRWNFLLDYHKDSQRRVVDESELQHDEDDDEVVRVHENNFRLPSFNHLTEENLLGVRQRRGRIRRLSQSDEVDETSVLPTKVQCRVESFRERDFVRTAMDKWPQLFRGVSFDYDEGLLVMRHGDVDTRWRFRSELLDLLKEVTRLGVDAEMDSGAEDEGELEQKARNGFSSLGIKREVTSDAEDGEGVVGGRLRQVDEPQVELFKEWHESVQVQSYNDELLTILPYVVID